MTRPSPRCARGFRDVFAEDVRTKRELVATVQDVYERYGFLPLETPAVEYVDVLGKFLPESDRPDGGIFSIRNPDADAAANPAEQWLALRYDLTAPLARVAAQYAELPRPFRRYQIGQVWRYEKPGPGRFREFTQFDIDTVGAASVAADAEICCAIADVFEALGFSASEYVVRVNDRKVLQGVLEACGLDDDLGAEGSRAMTVLRAIDKLDRLGRPGVRLLLGPGRQDETGDFTRGAGLAPHQIDRIEAFLAAKDAGRTALCDRLEELVGASAPGREGVAELREMDRFLAAAGRTGPEVAFDTTVVRGLGYYTGPVFEGVLTREVAGEPGQTRQFGSLFGGGRYDSLVERFTGQKMPATGASVGVDRLLEAVKLLRPGTPRTATAEVLVTTLDKNRQADYVALVQKIRHAGINAEIWLGGGGLGRQLKHADRLGIPLALIAGEDEFARGELQIKDLRLGERLAAGIADRDEWRKGQPAQQAVPAGEVVARLRALLER